MKLKLDPLLTKTEQLDAPLRWTNWWTQCNKHNSDTNTGKFCYYRQQSWLKRDQIKRYELPAPSYFKCQYSDSWPVTMGPTRCPETSVNNYHTTPCNIPEERRSYCAVVGNKNLYIYIYEFKRSKNMFLCCLIQSWLSLSRFRNYKCCGLQNVTKYGWSKKKFWVTTQYSLFRTYRRFAGTVYLHFQLENLI